VLEVAKIVRAEALEGGADAENKLEKARFDARQVIEAVLAERT